MTTSYHSPIASGAAANAATFNAPLAQLDAQLVALATLTTTAGGNVATLTDGAASAGQKVVDVDSTTGFIAGARVAYLLAGGTTLEYNTVGTVNTSTRLTLGANIGTGGIDDDSYVSMISQSEYAAAQAVHHGNGYETTMDVAMAMAAGNVYHPLGFGAAGDGITDDQGVLNYVANTEIATAGTILIDRPYAIADDLTIPKEVTLHFTRAGKIVVATAKTLTVQGPIVAGQFQIFDCQGTGAVAILNSPVWVHWFGAVPDDATVDAYTPFKQAVAAIQGVSQRTLELGSGVYTFASKNTPQDCCLYVDTTISIIGQRRCVLKVDAGLTPDSVIKWSAFGDSYAFSPHVLHGFEIDGNDLTRPFRVSRGLYVVWDAVVVYSNLRIAGVDVGMEAGLASYSDSGIWNGVLMNIYTRGEDRATNYQSYGYKFLSQCNGLRMSNCYATYCGTCLYMHDANYCTIQTEVEDSALAYDLSEVMGTTAHLACERCTRFADIEDCRGLTLDIVGYDVGDAGTPPANLLEFSASTGSTYNEVTINSFVWSAVAVGYVKQVEITQTYTYGLYRFPPVSGMIEALDTDGDEDWVTWTGVQPALVNTSVSGTYTPDCLNGARTTWILTLTGATTIAAPLRPQAGQRMTFLFTQGGAGGYAVTWNAAYRTVGVWSDSGNAAGTVCSMECVARTDGTLIAREQSAWY